MIKLDEVWVERKVRRLRKKLMPTILSFFLFHSVNREACQAQATLVLSPVSDYHEGKLLTNTLFSRIQYKENPHRILDRRIWHGGGDESPMTCLKLPLSLS